MGKSTRKSLVNLNSKDSRREAFTFLVGISLFFISLAIAFWAVYISISGDVSMLSPTAIMVTTYVLLGIGVLAGFTAIGFFIYCWTHKADDPQDKIPDKLDAINTQLAVMNDRLRQIGDKLGVKDDELGKL